MTLYHFAPRWHVESIMRDGFHDGDVWLSDISLLDDADPPLGPDFAQLVIPAPESAVAYVVAGNPLAGSGYREFRIRPPW